MKPEIGKRYRTNDGRVGRCICTDLKRNDGCNIVIAFAPKVEGNELVGLYRSDQLREVNEWEDFKIDEPVMVRNSDHDDWRTGHFAGIDCQGSPMTWSDGMTSWTTKTLSWWQQCRRPTEDERRNRRTT